MNQESLEKAVKHLDKILKDQELEVWEASNLPREEKATVQELTQNTDIARQLRSSKMAGSGLYFSEKLTRRPNQAYVDGGVVVLIVNGLLFKIPIDDISKISRVKKGEHLKCVMIWLTWGWIAVMWQSKDEMNKMIAREMRRRKRMKRRGNWYRLK